VKIGIIPGYGWAHISMPIFTTITHLRNSGYELYVFYERSEYCSSIGLNNRFFDYSDVNIIEYSPKDFEQSQSLSANEVAEDLDIFCANFIMSFSISFDVIIGYEPRGLIRGALIKSQLNCKLVYFSLEILDSDCSLKKAEIHYSKDADIIITQDKYRAEIISKLNDYDRHKIHPVFNTTIGAPINQKSLFLRETFKIPEDKIILLSPGSMLRSHGLYELLNIVPEFKNQIALVFHGWIPYSKDEVFFEKTKNKFPNTIYHSQKLFTHEEKFKVHASADVGFIFYEPRDLNYEYAAWSSGKFFDFMRCGIPVLCKSILNAESLVTENKVGSLYSDPKEIIPKALELGINKKDFIKSCHNTFSKYSFNDSFSKAFKNVI